jgi:hypothetical protein
LKGSSSAATGAGAAKAEAGTPDGSDEENGEETKESTAKAPAKAKAVAKAASKSTRKVPAKKTVGKATAPKKAGAAKVKAKGKGKKVQKDGVEGETKEGGEQEVDATEEAENEDGKSPSSINKSLATALQVNEESVAGNPANDYTEDEIYEAGERDISVEDWRIWKADNDYDPNYAPTPRGHVSDEES